MAQGFSLNMTDTPPPSSTPQPIAISTYTPRSTVTSSPTSIPSPTATSTPVPRPTATPTPTATSTPSVTPSSTPKPILAAIHGFTIEPLEPSNYAAVAFKIDAEQYLYPNPSYETGYLYVSVEQIVPGGSECPGANLENSYCIGDLSSYGNLSLPSSYRKVSYGRGIVEVWVGCWHNETGSPIQTNQVQISVKNCRSGYCTPYVSRIFNRQIIWDTTHIDF